MLATKTTLSIKPYFNYLDIISKVSSQGAKLLDLRISTDKMFVSYQYKFPFSAQIYLEEIHYNEKLDETLKWTFSVQNKTVTIYEK